MITSKNTQLFKSVLAGLIVFAPACGILSSEPTTEWVLRPGTIEFYNEPIVIEHPDTASLRRPLRILVRTYGGGCTTRGPTNATRIDTVITIEPLDSEIRPGPNQACRDLLKLYDHGVNMPVTQAGVHTIRVIGNREPGTQRVEFQSTVVVR